MNMDIIKGTRRLLITTATVLTVAVAAGWMIGCYSMGDALVDEYEKEAGKNDTASTSPKDSNDLRLVGNWVWTTNTNYDLFFSKDGNMDDDGGKYIDTSVYAATWSTKDGGLLLLGVNCDRLDYDDNGEEYCTSVSVVDSEKLDYELIGDDTLRLSRAGTDSLDVWTRKREGN